MMDCLFCRIAGGKIPADIVERGDGWVAFRDLNPQAPTHILLIPEKHVATLNDLVAEDDGLVGRIVRGAAEIAAAEGIAQEGYRLVFNCNVGAGQSVFHIHGHLLGGRTLIWPPG